MLFEEGFTQNREISWLRYNERVLEEALDESVPLFERLRFIAIFVKNLEEFFKVLIYGDEIELHNRFLRIGQEYGTTTAKAIADLHRHDDVVNRPDVGINRRNDGINSSNDVINDAINGVIKFTEKEEIAVKALVRDPRLSAARLADLIGVKQRQAQRIITSLKKKTGLKRRGADKNGEWYFDGAAK